MNEEYELQVWWVPQVPMKAFTWPVKSYAEGKALCDCLAQYDIFQFENNVKPDYCNAGGVRIRHATRLDGEWWDLEEEEAEELGL